MRSVVALIALLLVGTRCASPGDVPYRLPGDESLDVGLGQARIHSSHSGDAPVSIRVIVNKRGTIDFVHALDGPAGAFREAEVAERQVKFKPFLHNGKPVPISFTDFVSVLPLERWKIPKLSFPAIRDWRSVSIKMERRFGCFEPRCMGYIVQVLPNLKVDLQQGSFGFEDPKHFTADITRDHFNSLITAFRQADFFSMLDSYVYEGMTDGQRIIITFTADGQRKRVAQYHGALVGAPDSLLALANRIDDLTETKQWNERR